MREKVAIQRMNIVHPDPNEKFQVPLEFGQAKVNMQI
jgi:hypothetical protein